MLENLSPKENEILTHIKTVIDPEVAVNIVDLGLIYEVNCDEEKRKIHILATLSARGCPVGDTIFQHIETVVTANNPGYEVEAELTWEPEWTPDLITDDGRKELNM